MLLVGVFGKPEIRYLAYSIVQKNVSDFEISMHYAPFSQIQKPSVDILDIRGC